MINLKKITLFFTVLCFCLLLVPTTVQASEVYSDFFTVDLRVGEENGIAPGDIFTETFVIENTADHTIKVRLYDVDNVKDSPLYPILTAGWAKEEQDIETFVGFDNLKSNWYIVKPGEKLELTLDMHFPAEYGNTYQGKALKAKFIFESRIPREVVGDTGKPNPDVPKTGDESNLLLWGVLSTVSGCALMLILWADKRRKNGQA